MKKVFKMQEQENSTAQIIGAAFLSAVLLFGVGGIIVYGVGNEPVYQPDELYEDECGV